MRQITVAALLSILAISPAIAGTGHWYCTADGIKSWTTNAATTDAHGWTYGGDRSVYKDPGHCKHAM